MALLRIYSHEEEPADPTPHFFRVWSLSGRRLGVIVRDYPTPGWSRPFELDFPILVRGKLWFRFRGGTVEGEGKRLRDRCVLCAVEGQMKTLWFIACCWRWEN